MARGLGLQGILARTDPAPDGNGEPVDDQAGARRTARAGGGYAHQTPRQEGPVQARREAPRLQADHSGHGFRPAKANRHQARESTCPSWRRDPRSKLPYFTVTQYEKPPATTE